MAIKPQPNDQNSSRSALEKQNGHFWGGHNSCRDPSGMINKIFKPGVIGVDLQVALLDLFNFANGKCKFWIS